jgi:hypothetical protein
MAGTSPAMTPERWFDMTGTQSSIVAGRKTKVRREKNQGCAKENNADAKA